jgi:hypothetical protein
LELEIEAKARFVCFFEFAYGDNIHSPKRKVIWRGIGIKGRQKSNQKDKKQFVFHLNPTFETKCD